MPCFVRLGQRSPMTEFDPDLSHYLGTGIATPGILDPTANARHWLPVIAKRAGAQLEALELRDPAGLEALARWGRPVAELVEAEQREWLIDGHPPWRLSAWLGRGSGHAAAVLDGAVLSLEVSRRAQDWIGRSQERLAQRGAELEVLQSIGRGAAQASEPLELFGATLSAVESYLDVAIVVFPWEGRLRRQALLTRPFQASVIDRIVERATRFVGIDAPVLELELVHAASFDADRGSSDLVDDDSLIVIPLQRGGRSGGVLFVVPSEVFPDSGMRALFGAANHLSQHLERLAALRSAEIDRFRAIVESLPHGVVVVEGGRGGLHVNLAASALLASAGIGLERGVDGVLDALGLSSLVQAYRECSRATHEAEARLEGDRTWTVTLAPLGGDSATREGFILVLHDVTPARRLEKRLAQTEKISSVGQMISGVAHELNNPLASIVGYAQLLRAAPTHQQTVARVELLQREAERCRKIVRNLLSFVRAHEPETRPVSLNQAVRDAASLLNYQFRVDNVELDLDLSSDVPAILGDAHQLEQLLVNLLSNARQAIRQVGPAGAILVRSSSGEDGVRLEVSDTGPGVPQAIRTRIFDPFFTTKEPGEGTGLGLSLVLGIVAAHRGQIEVDDNPGGGAVFRILFPISSRSAADATDPRSGGPSATRVRGRILVIDDEEPLAHLICEALQADGHETEWACDGRAGLECVGQRSFDLIVADLRMPGMGGLDLLDELRQSRPELSRRMILTTGDTVSQSATEIATRGGIELLHKPFDLDELRERVRARIARP